MTVSRQPIECVLFDLDDCLYRSEEMSHKVAENIRKYMVERLGVAPEEVMEKCLELYLNYGTTLAGLVVAGHSIDYDDWHAHVHATLDYEAYLQPDPALRALLLSLPLPKYVFTNADRVHAQRCLAILGIQDCFDGLICFESIMEAAAERGWVRHGRPVVCKPNRQAYQLALEAAGSPSPAATLWLDDSTRNITTGHRLGMLTVLVGRTGVDTPSDYQIETVHSLPTVLPWLWEQQPDAHVRLAAQAQQHKQQQQQVPTQPSAQQQQQQLVKAEPSLVGSPQREVAAFM